MRILAFKIYTGVSHATSFINQSCIKALKEFGHTISEVDLKGVPVQAREGIRFLGERIIRFKPDLIFTINNYGIIPPLIRHLELPYASWFVDTPFGLKGDDASPFGAIFFWEKGFIKEFKDFGFRYVGHLSSCTDPNIFREIDLSLEDRERYECNISFVGSSFYSFYEECQKEILKMKKESKIRFLFEEVMKRKEERPLEDNLKILNGLDHDPLSLSGFKEILQGASVTIARKAILDEVREFGLSIYGDNGWRSLFSNDIVSIYPPIHYHKELPKLYNASKINLNISSPQKRSSIPPRIFDISACGGFVLTDYLPDLKELFRIDEEVVVYEDREELHKKTQYFLEHPDERKEIAQNARKIVLRGHTYKERMEELLSIIKDCFF